LGQVLDRAAERGDIPASTDRSFVTAALMGPLYYRRWFAREPVDEQFIVALVRSVLGGFGDEIRQGV
jgi:hypothetical protein